VPLLTGAPSMKETRDRNDGVGNHQLTPGYITFFHLFARFVFWYKRLPAAKNFNNVAAFRLTFCLARLNNVALAQQRITTL